MADYYPLLVRAIAGLAQNTGETRKIVFDRARGALLKQLRSVEPPLPEGEIGRERQALESAIRRIEEENKPEPVEEPVVEEPVAEPEAPPPAPPVEAPPEPTPPPAPEPVEAPAAQAEPEEAVSPATDQRPKVGRGNKVGSRSERPRMPAKEAGTGAPRWQRTVLVVALIGVLIAGGAYAIVNRETLFGGQKQTAAVVPAQPADAAKSADHSKSSDRVNQASTDNRRSPVAAPRASATTQRAYLFEEAQGAAQGLQSYEGTVTWKTETVNGGPGMPPDLGIRADLQIPGRMSISFTLRRNTDQALPASHTVEITFTLPADFAYGGISNVPGIRMKQTESAQGAPLAGLSVRVSPTYFLVGLSAVQADKERNIELLQTRPWIDIPVVYTNQKRAILAFEKGPTGDAAFRDAFSAWGELLPTAPPPMPFTPPG